MKPSRFRRLWFSVISHCGVDDDGALLTVEYHRGGQSDGYDEDAAILNDFFCGGAERMGAVESIIDG